MNVQLGNPDSTRARARWWGTSGDVLQVVLTDHRLVPRPEELEGWLAAARRAGAARVRTGALFPPAADLFADAGFAVIDTLALLTIDLDGRAPTDVDEARSDTGARTAPLRRRHDATAADIDRHAFGEPWANDIDDLAEIRHATPVHRARGRFATGSGWRRPLLGFAITGAAAGNGYLQRLAVDPAHQHDGHGRALTLDALAWMRRRRLRAGYVNTAVTNDAALALYASVGFRPRPERLVVMQRTVA